MTASAVPSWEGAYNNCLSLPSAHDARLLAIETIDEYEFIERELIGLKSGPESVSVYIGLRKINRMYFLLCREKRKRLKLIFILILFRKKT